MRLPIFNKLIEFRNSSRKLNGYQFIDYPVHPARSQSISELVLLDTNGGLIPRFRPLPVLFATTDASEKISVVYQDLFGYSARLSYGSTAKALWDRFLGCDV